LGLSKRNKKKALRAQGFFCFLERSTLHILELLAQARQQATQRILTAAVAA